MRNGTIAYSQAYGSAFFASTHHNYRQVGSDGWCVNHAGAEGVARYFFDGRLQFDGAASICNQDSSCIAYAYLNSENPDLVRAVFYSSTNQCRAKGGADCDNNIWSTNPSLITRSSGVPSWTCHVKGEVNNTKGGKKAVNSTPFRWGSVSKPVTAAAFMVLVQKGLVSLDTFALRCGNGSIGPLAYLAFNTSTCVPKFSLGDIRMQNITMRHLLQMTAGWDQDTVTAAYAAYNTQKPAASIQVCRETCTDVVEFILSQPLQHSPGSKNIYFNPGYCALGLAIQSLSLIHI